MLGEKVAIFAGNPLVDFREGELYQETQLEAFETALSFARRYSGEVAGIYILFDQLGDMRRFLSTTRTKGLRLHKMLKEIARPYLPILEKYGFDASDIRVMMEGQLRMSMLNRWRSNEGLGRYRPELFGEPGSCREGVPISPKNYNSENPRVTCRGLTAEVYSRCFRLLNGDGLIKAFWQYDQERGTIRVISDGLIAAKRALGVSAKVETEMIMPSGESIELPLG